MKRLLAIVLTLAVLPVPGTAADARAGGGESDAWLAERAQQGASETERGCSVFFHVCSCHVSMSSAPAAGHFVATKVPDVPRGSISCEANLLATRSADPPALPPPIA